jgi:hypothetical protein
MEDNRTPSILQRVPVILAVTAASYGLAAAPSPARGFRRDKCTSLSSAMPIARRTKRLQPTASP